MLNCLRCAGSNIERAGATILMEPKDQFYGERSSKLLDSYGHLWMLGQHIENVSTEEMQQRYTQLLSKSEK